MLSSNTRCMLWSVELFRRSKGKLASYRRLNLLIIFFRSGNDLSIRSEKEPKVVSFTFRFSFEWIYIFIYLFNLFVIYYIYYLESSDAAIISILHRNANFSNYVCV